MAIQINSEWQIDSDQYNWILQKKIISKDKETGEVIKEYWANQGYYGTLPDAVKGLADLAIKVPDSVIGVLGVLAELHQIIDKRFPADTPRGKDYAAQSKVKR
jgi:hypothetical protein